MIRALLILALLAPPASADMLSSFAFHAPIQAADAWSTAVAFEAGGRERNPLLGRTIWSVVAMKIPATLLLSWGDSRVGKRSKLLQWSARAVVVAAYAWIVNHNLQQRRVVR